MISDACIQRLSVPHNQEPPPDFDDPRILEIALNLKLDRGQVIGALCLLWLLVDERTENNELPQITKDEIDYETNFKGFANELVKVGWMVFSEHGAAVWRPAF